MSGPHARALRQAIAGRTATFGVIGQGYVGLPLAVAVADSAPGSDANTVTFAGDPDPLINPCRALSARDAG